jgi:hypothetical protein
MVEERTQRRLAAILAADVVGFSRLMEADESGTMAALKVRRKDVLDPLVAKHQGRIFKTTGDGVLIEFASAVNAVQCAVDLQQGMAAQQADWTRVQILLDERVEIGARIVDNQDRVATSLRETPTPGFTIWDMRTQWQITEHFRLTAGVENIGDRTYREHLDFRFLNGVSIFQLGRNFYLGGELVY